jgi:hypothetical protein
VLSFATKCATIVSAISSISKTTSASGANYRSNDATSGVTYSGTCKFTTYGLPVNLPFFVGYPHEDPAFYVERFEEILISNFITRPEYYLIWFPNTLVEGAYTWYRSNAMGSFQTWRHLQAVFLQQFRPVIGQQQALAALTDIRQGPSEDIISYIRRFRVVCIRYVGTLLNDETIKHYFIQGFDRYSTRREVLSRRSVTTEDAINAALEVEVVDKEDDRMERRTNEPIPAFISLTHRPNDFPGYSHQSNP